MNADDSRLVVGFVLWSFCFVVNDRGVKYTISGARATREHEKALELLLNFSFSVVTKKLLSVGNIIEKMTRSESPLRLAP